MTFRIHDRRKAERRSDYNSADVANAWNDGYKTALDRYRPSPQLRAARLAVSAALILFGIVAGLLYGFTVRVMPYCQEDEVILFSLPERDTFWCQHIDTLPNLFNPPLFDRSDYTTLTQPTP